MKIRFFLLAFLMYSTCAKSQSDFQIISSFYQGSANNCASIALIKAALYKYGFNKMFSYSQLGGKYNIILKDGTKLSISLEEYNSSVSYSNFDTTGSYEILGSSKDSVLFYAYLSYAIIAKNISQNGYWGCADENGRSSHIKRIRSFQKALVFITRTSYCTDNCYRLLGLRIKDNRIFDFDGINELNDKGLILYSWGHEVAVYNDQLDCYGDWLPVSANKVCNNRFK